MLFRLRRLWQPLRESLWFVPLLMALTSLALAYGLIQYDQATSVTGTRQLPPLFGIDADGAGGMLTSISSSMLTVAALTFSLLLAALAQVSNRYSPRALRNFMRDPVNQFVMGYFVSVFTFGLVVQGTIRSGRADKFVPTTAVLVGLLLALGGVGALIFFIHHHCRVAANGYACCWPPPSAACPPTTSASRCRRPTPSCAPPGWPKPPLPLCCPRARRPSLAAKT